MATYETRPLLFRTESDSKWPAVIYSVTTSCACPCQPLSPSHRSLPALGLEAFNYRVTAQEHVSDLSMGPKSQSGESLGLRAARAIQGLHTFLSATLPCTASHFSLRLARSCSVLLSGPSGVMASSWWPLFNSSWHSSSFASKAEHNSCKKTQTMTLSEGCFRQTDQITLFTFGLCSTQSACNEFVHG